MLPSMFTINRGVNHELFTTRLLATVITHSNHEVIAIKFSYGPKFLSSRSVIIMASYLT